jgi:hypothetical protein
MLTTEWENNSLWQEEEALLNVVSVCCLILPLWTCPSSQSPGWFLEQRNSPKHSPSGWNCSTCKICHHSNPVYTTLLTQFLNEHSTNISMNRDTWSQRDPRTHQNPVTGPGSQHLWPSLHVSKPRHFSLNNLITDSARTCWKPLDMSDHAVDVSSFDKEDIIYELILRNYMLQFLLGSFSGLYIQKQWRALADVLSTGLTSSHLKLSKSNNFTLWPPLPTLSP